MPGVRAARRAPPLMEYLREAMRPLVRAVGLLLLTIVWPGAAFAQRDLSGEWSARYHEDQEHRIPGPALGDYTGLPINDAARLKADSWDASILSLREHQAKPHPSRMTTRLRR